MRSVISSTPARSGHRPVPLIVAHDPRPASHWTPPATRHPPPRAVQFHDPHVRPPNPRYRTDSSSREPPPDQTAPPRNGAESVGDPAERALEWLRREWRAGCDGGMAYKMAASCVGRLRDLAATNQAALALAAIEQRLTGYRALSTEQRRHELTRLAAEINALKPHLTLASAPAPPSAPWSGRSRPAASPAPHPRPRNRPGSPPPPPPSNSPPRPRSPTCRGSVRPSPRN
jgi:hypothetical protein